MSPRGPDPYRFVTPGSSNIAEVGYDPDNRRLEVVFQSGATYWYDDVDEAVFDSFRRAPSKGRFFISQVKDVYNADRVG